MKKLSDECVRGAEGLITVIDTIGFETHRTPLRAVMTYVMGVNDENIQIVNMMQISKF